jgi:hypothetical protein
MTLPVAAAEVARRRGSAAAQTGIGLASTRETVGSSSMFDRRE